MAHDVAEELSKDPKRYGLRKMREVDLPEGIKEVGFKDGTILRAKGV